MLHTFYIMSSSYAFSDLGGEFETTFYHLLPSHYPRAPNSPTKMAAKSLNAV